MAQKEQCFVITPIGDDTSDIRRHIEGIIDAVITPALENEYDVVVAHRISTPGSITKQIIEAIYNSKLVIANLTNCNPNVMYELALRHGIGKPVIMIAVEGTKLPSVIMMQRTIFYRNDALGVLELRDKLKATAAKIDFEKKCGMVFEVLGEISHDAAMLKNVAEKDSDSKEPLEYIMQRLDRIEALMPAKIEMTPPRSILSGDVLNAMVTYFESPPEWNEDNQDSRDIHLSLCKRLGVDLPGCELLGIGLSDNQKRMRINIRISDSTAFNEWKICALLRHRLLALGFTGVDVSFI